MEYMSDSMMQWGQQEDLSALQPERRDDINSFFSLDSFDLSPGFSPAYQSSLLSQISGEAVAPKPSDKEDMVSVSSIFFPGSHKPPSDTIFRSSDTVLFYVHCNTILKASRQAFEIFLKAPLSEPQFRNAVIDIPETSSILNIILNTVYGQSCAKNSPDFDDLEKAVDQMPLYGIPPTKHLLPDTPLFDTLISHAPIYPIRVYALAGKFNAYELAVKTSSHLLSYRLSELTDELAIKMGAIYLRRLMTLHMTLIDTLKTIILQPPPPHPSTRTCDFVEQKKLSRAWALAASYLAWDSRPDLSIHQMQNTLAALGDYMDCDQCKEVLGVRVKEVVVKWVNVKRTI
ncbi:hypothetical protein BDN70DRAFT_874347 [Pholiota conissans]|uniref:BTB domain-containing protein n=1 Tax=Pholiota conissans TaxID=109636 RepID=A0A9P6CXG6_9AGAR|nr:hypothetical protein BDN70DRAFT_874347 [Pholiota conissans]